MQAATLEALRGVDAAALEDWALFKLKQFSVVFAQELVPDINQAQLDLAFSRALYTLTARSADGEPEALELRFTHDCRFMGCASPDCMLCKNNPKKTCEPGANFDEAYADNQVLRARCEADIWVELVNPLTGEVFAKQGVEVQLSAIDGDAYSPAAEAPLATVVELHTSDDDKPLLASQGATRPSLPGTVVVALQGGRARLPDVSVTDKNDTFHFGGGNTTSHFRLLAIALRRDEMGQPVALDAVQPGVSNAFVVKTQRALNDYRKSPFPHYKDKITTLRYVGAMTASRLEDAKASVSRDCPLDSVRTVAQLKQLVEYADSSKAVEAKLLELLNMRGKHRHKWEALRAVLADKVVYDDAAMRTFFKPGDRQGLGLLYTAKQAQVTLDRPAGVLQRVAAPGGGAGGSSLQVCACDFSAAPQLQELRHAAEAAWRQPGHPGWKILSEPLVEGPPLAGSASAGAPLAAAAAAAAAAGTGLYPTVSRGELGTEVGLQQVPSLPEAYPAISRPLQDVDGFGLAPQAQAPLRTQSDVTMLQTQPHGFAALRTQSDAATAAAAVAAAAPVALRSMSDLTPGACHPRHGLGEVDMTAWAADDSMLPPIAQDDADSAFLLQHPGDAVEAAMRQQDEPEQGTKRGRATPPPAPQAAAAAGPQAAQALYHTESRGRHRPARKLGSGGDAAASGGAGLPPLLQQQQQLEQQQQQQQRMLSAGPPAALGMPEFMPLDSCAVDDLLQSLQSERDRSGSGSAGAAAAAAAASASAAQHHGGAGAAAPGREGGLTGTFSSLNLNPHASGLSLPTGEFSLGLGLGWLTGGDMGSGPASGGAAKAAAAQAAGDAAGAGAGAPAGDADAPSGSGRRVLAEVDSFRAILAATPFCAGQASPEH